MGRKTECRRDGGPFFAWCVGELGRTSSVTRCWIPKNALARTTQRSCIPANYEPVAANCLGKGGVRL